MWSERLFYFVPSIKNIEMCEYYLYVYPLLFSLIYRDLFPSPYGINRIKQHMQISVEQNYHVVILSSRHLVILCFKHALFQLCLFELFVFQGAAVESGV